MAKVYHQPFPSHSADNCWVSIKYVCEVSLTPETNFSSPVSMVLSHLSHLVPPPAHPSPENSLSSTNTSIVLVLSPACWEHRPTTLVKYKHQYCVDVVTGLLGTQANDACQVQTPVLCRSCHRPAGNTGQRRLSSTNTSIVSVLSPACWEHRPTTFVKYKHQYCVGVVTGLLGTQANDVCQVQTPVLCRCCHRPAGNTGQRRLSSTNTSIVSVLSPACWEHRPTTLVHQSYNGQLDYVCFQSGLETVTDLFDWICQP